MHIKCEGFFKHPLAGVYHVCISVYACAMLRGCTRSPMVELSQGIGLCRDAQSHGNKVRVGTEVTEQGGFL